MDEHLDVLGLDAVRAGDATPDQRAHADRCADCRAAVDQFRSLATRLTPARFDVPAAVTRKILAPKRNWRPYAAAAAVLITAGLWFFGRPKPAVHRIDIVDAYSVAWHLRNNQAVDASWDLNGDGKIDAQDVDEIARRSVAIK